MSTIGKHWPAIRQIVYSVAAAALAVAAILGYLTDEQVAQWLDEIGKWLGFAGLIVAGLYVNRSPAAPAPPVTDVYVTGEVTDDVRAEALRRLRDGSHPR
ncbi:hypothetical protein RCF27_08175 [Rhodococcus pyridinivorans]|uniref:hypothetical protein n=1 Tax=Rhodococcus pyridinivorans TaxID=103816 RepID=UPI00280B3DC2|nr:hypothetical protein [Rhodococcus pyridinivorans]WMM74254.1 hypothetical protein RCF27_08175 [Rhodococcus pyridinivorans]